MKFKLVIISTLLPILGLTQMDCEAIDSGYSGSCKTMYSNNKTVKIEGSCVNGKIVEMTRYAINAKVQERGEFNPDSLEGGKKFYTNEGKLSRLERINGDSLIVQIFKETGNRKVRISTTTKSDYATWEYYSGVSKLDSSVIYRQYTDAGYFRQNCPYLSNSELKRQVDSIFTPLHPNYIRDSISLASESVFFELLEQRELPNKDDKSKKQSLPSAGITIVLDAEFPNGNAELQPFFKMHLNYPDRPRLKRITGRVFLTFYVETTGQLTFSQVIGTNDLDLKREAIKLFCTMPNWKPAMEDGVPFRQAVRIPLTFY